ncbi:hypothetical protein B0T25DRAFT_187507 [Lasiosphaeria hispida]|uniref:Ribosomal protein S21 n=1 Tax=Lasiosphaeria hispida TaxID=260671 RepID=A0AAJ0HHI1_9PEZI|nr:hypothetical protein B0T25DRAFT_187507 [Lasiosphaeria hispida]
MAILQTACRSAAASSARPSFLIAAHPFRAAAASSIIFQYCRFSTTRPSLKDTSSSFPNPRPAPRTSIESLKKGLRSGTNTSLPPRPGPPVDDLLSTGAFRRASPNRAFSAAEIPHMIANDASNGLKKWSSQDFEADYLRAEKERTIRTRPSTGRTVLVTGSSDVGRSFRTLEMLCKRNKVSREFNLQRFHERPALKRKRQKRERWRVRFQQGMRSTISRVMQLRAQGW